MNVPYHFVLKSIWIFYEVNFYYSDPYFSPFLTFFGLKRQLTLSNVDISKLKWIICQKIMPSLSNFEDLIFHLFIIKSAEFLNNLRLCLNPPWLKITESLIQLIETIEKHCYQTGHFNSTKIGRKCQNSKIQSH